MFSLIVGSSVGQSANLCVNSPGFPTVKLFPDLWITDMWLSCNSPSSYFINDEIGSAKLANYGKKKHK